MSASATKPARLGTKPKGRGSTGRSPLLGRYRSLPFLFVAPATLLVAVILGFPVVFGIYRSLFRIEILNPSRPFIGLENYTDLFSDPLFWSAMAKSLIFIAGCMVLGGFLAVYFAFALNRATAGLRFLRGLSLVPYIVSSIAAAVLFRMLFNREFGLANQTLQLFGFEGIGWLSDPIAAMFAVVVTQVWTDLPIAILIVLGGLQTIDPDLLDAASVDGATGWQRTRRVTLPLIAPQLGLAAVFLSFHALTSLGVILGLTGGGPGRATETLSIAMYDTAFRLLDQGGALAIMVIIFAINAALTVIYIWFGRQRTV
jgi:multiple sugar transport system permease protein